MRMRKKPNLIPRLERCDGVLIAQPEQLKGKWLETFGGSRLELEIGCGKGRFINTLAQQNPDVLFIGLEREQGALVMAAEKAVESGLSNIRFIDGDAAKLSEFFTPDELARVYLNFSDPWPKSKHSKRRLTYRDFLMSYAGVLKDNGEIFVKTDNKGLFEFTLNELAFCDFKMKNITFDLHSTGMENVMTEYEERFSSQGMPIYRVEAYKR